MGQSPKLDKFAFRVAFYLLLPFILSYVLLLHFSCSLLVGSGYLQVEYGTLSAL